MHKLNFNTLHLHLTDDQAIGFENNIFDLDGKYLTFDEQRAIAKQCEAYDIDVIPEIDIPGHSVALQHYIHDDIEIETRLGIITTRYIELDDLEIVFNLLDDLIEIFSPKMIHFGGDEAKEFDKWFDLVDKIWSYAKDRKLKFVMWDDVLGKIYKTVDKMKDDIIIQRWRFWCHPVIKDLNYILSMNYYLDHCDTPMTLEKANPLMFRNGHLLGWIACTWTELIDESNYWNTLIPSVYILSERFSHPEQRICVPTVLHEYCERYGYPETNVANAYEWQMRRWDGFKNPDSIRCITKAPTMLTREHDRYPVFSRFLIDLLYDLYNLYFKDGDTTETIEQMCFILREEFETDDERWLIDKSKILAIIKKLPDAETYKNGLAGVLRCIRGEYLKASRKT
jgi:hypothetical protein